MGNEVEVRPMIVHKTAQPKTGGGDNENSKDGGGGEGETVMVCTPMAVSVNSVILKALQLSREFREKTYTARHSAMHQFINVHGFIHQMGTHLSQHQPSEMEQITTDFVCVIRQKL